MAIRIEWHSKALRELEPVSFANRERIRKTIAEIERLDDPRQRLVPYSDNLKGFWKLRVGDYRLICELRPRVDNEFALVIHVAHRSTAYDRRSISQVMQLANEE